MEYLVRNDTIFSIKNRFLMQTLRQKLNMSIGLPSPKWLLELESAMINTETELVLKSRWVVPEKILKAGYEFKFPKIENALDDLLK